MAGSGSSAHGSEKTECGGRWRGEEEENELRCSPGALHTFSRRHRPYQTDSHGVVSLGLVGGARPEVASGSQKSQEVVKGRW